MNWNTARGYCWDRALRLLGGQPARTTAAIVLIAVALVVPGLALMAGQMLAPFADRMPVAEAIVFVASRTPNSELKALHARVEAIDGVAQVSLVPRDEAWAQLQKRAAGAKTAAEFGANPLPDVLIAQFASRIDPSVVEAGAAALRRQPRVESVQADLDWYRRYFSLTKVALAAFGAVAIAVTLLLAVLVTGLVSGLVTIDRTEVTLLYQIGADADFVRMPSLYAGALIFGLGAAGGLGLLGAIRLVANPALAQLGEAFGEVSLGLPFPNWPLVVAFVALWLICGAAVGNLAATRPTGLSGDQTGG